MKNKKLIGVVGGVGPYAGLDLVRKIFDNTKAKSDQDHLSVALISQSEDIVDRTEFLIGKNKTNPANEIFNVIKKLESVGASVAGIPCNSSHAPKIFNQIKNKLNSSSNKVKLLHMIEEVADYIKKEHPKIKKVGLLCTIGTYNSKIYQNILEKKEIVVITPTEKMKKDLVHDAIYNTDYGIKSQSNPVTNTAKNNLIEAVKYLKKQGAEAIILGCTEIPLALTESRKFGMILIDPTNTLARALIREFKPLKLSKRL